MTRIQAAEPRYVHRAHLQSNRIKCTGYHSYQREHGVAYRLLFLDERSEASRLSSSRPRFLLLELSPERLDPDDRDDRLDISNALIPVQGTDYVETSKVTWPRDFRPIFQAVCSISVFFR